MSAACAVISLGGLTGFWVPVKMTLIGFAALLVALYLTPSCAILPNLLMMTFLSELSHACSKSFFHLCTVQYSYVPYSTVPTKQSFAELM